MARSAATGWAAAFAALVARAGGTTAARAALIALLQTGLVGALWGQTRTFGDPNFNKATDWRSGWPEVLTVQSQDAEYAFDGTTAEIPFTLQGTGATVWLAVYTKDASPQYAGQPLGRGGPGGALLRAAGLDTMVYVSSGEEFPEGSNVIRWDGRDWTGQRVPAGQYTFYLFALDRGANPTWCGGAFGPWETTRIDTRKNPPEMWWPRNDGAPVLQLDGITHTPGWAIHKSVMGTDFHGNPEGWETFNVPWMNQILARNTDWKDIGGYELDTADPTIGYILQFQYAPAGIWRVKYDAAAGTILPDETSWPNADRGFLAREPRTYNTAISNAFHHPWVPDDGLLYYTWTDRVDPKTPAVVVLDRATGEIVEIVDYSDFYLVEYTDDAGAAQTYTPGPTGIDVDETGIYTSAFWMSSGPPNGMPWVDLPSFPLKRTYDGDVLWQNGNGDGFVDRYQGDEAAARGINPVDQLVNVNCKVGRWGITIWSGYNNPQWGEFFGPDGAGLFKVMVDRMPATLLGEAWWMDNDSSIDGYYLALGWSSSNEGTVHWPFDVTRGLLTPPPAVPVWSVGIGVTNSRGVRVDVELGLAGGGSDGLDSGLGERALPPVPPASAFDVRWRLPSGEGSEVDYRGTASLGPAVTWTLSIQSSSRALPVTVSWDPTQLPVAGVYRLQDVETGGEVVNLDLRHQSWYQVTSVGLTELQVVYELVTQTYDLPAGWSLVSLPCALPDARLSAIFPQAISLYRHRGRYELVTAFEPGVGYWVNLPSATQVTVRGPAYPDSAVAAALPEEWSLVGLGERTLDVAGLRVVYPSLVSVFGYLSGYFSAAAMTPGAAYWVNLSAPTQLDLSGAVAAAGAGKPVLAGLPAWTGPTLWAEGPGGSQAIALGAPAAAIVALPPLPPTGAFDVRVAVGSGVEACQVPAGGEPYRVRWQGGVDRLRWDLPGTSGWEVEVDGVVVPLAGQGELQVTASSAAWLRPGAVLPSATVLHPCYPNPFNPTTTIPYDLAQAGPVRLRVYAINGQLVRELVSALQPAGSYRVTWDGRDQAGQAVGNGVYLCELRAGEYRAVRRVALMK